MSDKHGINNEYTNSFKKRISLNTVITTSNPKYSTITAENTYKRIPAPSHNTEENSNILNQTTKITYRKEVTTKPKPKVFIYDSNSSNYRTVLGDEKQRNTRGFPRSNTEANKIIPIRTFDIKNIPTNERLTTYKREEKTIYQNQAKALIDRMNRSRKNGISNNDNQNKTTYIRGYHNEKGSELISQSHDFDLDNKIENRTFIQNTYKNNDINKSGINEKRDQFQRRYRGEIVTPNTNTNQFINSRKNIIHGFSNIRKNETNPAIKNETNNTKQPIVSIKDYHYHQVTQKRKNDANDAKETNPNNSYFYQNKISYIMHNNTNTNLNSNNNRLNQNRISSSNLNNQNDENNKRSNKSRLSYTLENNPYYSQVIPKRDNNEERPTYDRGIAKNRQQQNIKLDKYMDKKTNKEEEKTSGQKTVIETSDGPVIEKIRNKDGSVTTIIRQTKVTPQNPQFGQVKTTRGTSDIPSVKQLITQDNKTVSSYNKDNKTLPSDGRQNRVVDRRNKFNEDDKNNKSNQGRNVEKAKEKKNENVTEKKEYFFGNKRQQYKNQKLENKNNDNKASNYNTSKKDETSSKGTVIISDRRGNRSNIQNTNTNTNTKPVNNNENTSRKGGTIRIGKRGDRNNNSNQVNDDRNIIKTEKNEDKTNTQKKTLPTLNNINTSTRGNNNRSDNDNSRPLNTDGNISTRKNIYQSRRDKDNNTVNDLTTIKTGKNDNMNLRIGGRNNALDDKLKTNDFKDQKKSDRAKSGNRKQLRSSLKHGKRRKSAAPKKVKFGKSVKKVGIKQNTDTGITFNVNDNNNTKEETNNTLKEKNEEELLIEEINRKGESASRQEKQKRLDYLINLYGQCCLGFYKSTEESILEKIADVLSNVGENDKKEILYKFNNTFPKSKELYQKLNSILSKKCSTAGKVMIYDTNDNVRQTNFNSGNVIVSRSTDPQISNDGSSPFDKYFKDRQAKIKKASS